MSNFSEISKRLTQLEQTPPEATKVTTPLPQADNGKQALFKKMRGGLLFVIGYLLSPLSFWNDLFFNLPVAYGFGYLWSWISQDWFLPATIVGYWLSNIAGILLMQFGAIDVLRESPKERNFKKELAMGILSSTAYSLLILALVQFKILDASFLFTNGNSINLGFLLP